MLGGINLGKSDFKKILQMLDKGVTWTVCEGSNF